MDGNRGTRFDGKQHSVHVREATRLAFDERVPSNRIVRTGCVSLLLRFRRLLVSQVLLVATRAYFSSGLIFPAVPLTSGRIRPARHARHPRGRGDVQHVLLVARRTIYFRAFLCS